MLQTGYTIIDGKSSATEVTLKSIAGNIFEKNIKRIRKRLILNSKCLKALADDAFILLVS